MVINSENVSMDQRPSRLPTQPILDAQNASPFNNCALDTDYNRNSIFLHILFTRGFYYYAICWSSHFFC